MPSHPPSDHVAEIVATFAGTVLDVRHLGPRERGGAYAIGASPECDFPVADPALLDPARFALVHVDDEGVSVAFTASMDGSVVEGGTRTALGELHRARRAVADGPVFRHRLAPGARVHLRLGAVVFHVRTVGRDRSVIGRGEVDRAFWGGVAGAGLVAGVLVGLAALVPADVLAFELEEDRADSRFVAFHHVADEAREEPAERSTGDARSAGGEGRRHAGEEGAMGRPDSTREAGRFRLRGTPQSIPHLARTIDPGAEARHAGILGLMQRDAGHVFASVHGGAFAIGRDDEDLWGGLHGPNAGEAHGVIGGLGLVGTGRGGGGTAEGLIGLGNTGLLDRGRGGGKGTSWGPGDGKGVAFADRSRRGPRVVPENTTVLGGGMDKSIIRRIVRAHINEIRACYNAGLVRDPSLRGRVAVQFSIAGTGRVASAVVGESTLTDAAVGRCMAQAVARWQFPRPPGGGIVIVSYPFTVEPAA
jgi:TonB family protein